MTRSPLVSVIIPAYNARAFVLDALASVEAQRVPAVQGVQGAQAGFELEILLIDDGSTDGTADLVAAEMPRVRIIRQANAGVAAARNTGLLAAMGEFITFLDADDGWFPGKLRAQLDYLAAHPEVGLVWHRWLVWRPDDAGVFHWPEPPRDLGSPESLLSGWLYLPLLQDCVVHTSTAMIRRAVVAEVGLFDADLKIGEDYDYWLRIARRTRMHQLAPVYSFYRATPGSLTSRPRERNYEYEVIRRAVERWGLCDPGGQCLPRARMDARLGKLALDFAYQHLRPGGSAPLARAASWQALRHQPWRLKPWLYILASLLRPGQR